MVQTTCYLTSLIPDFQVHSAILESRPRYTSFALLVFSTDPTLSLSFASSTRVRQIRRKVLEHDSLRGTPGLPIKARFHREPRGCTAVRMAKKTDVMLLMQVRSAKHAMSVVYDGTISNPCHHAILHRHTPTSFLRRPTSARHPTFVHPQQLPRRPYPGGKTRPTRHQQRVPRTR
jgi:hypothetical protein